MHIGCLIISEFGKVSHLAHVSIRGLEGDSGCSHGFDGLGRVGVSPGKLSTGVFSDGLGIRGPKVIFCHISLPSAICWSVFL